MVAPELVRALERLHQREVGRPRRVHVQGGGAGGAEDLGGRRREGEDVAVGEGGGGVGC